MEPEPTTIPDRPVFRPKCWRPPLDEQWEMKQAVIARDGLTDCFWCRRSFASLEDATLEHILPLADGGRHDLRNCTLACETCNGRNVPKSVIGDQARAAEFKYAGKIANVLLNGGPAEDCADPLIVARFPAIRRARGGRALTFADASFTLKNIHRQLGLFPPSKHEKHVFKGHFNRWQNVRLGPPAIPSGPASRAF